MPSAFVLPRRIAAALPLILLLMAAPALPQGEHVEQELALSEPQEAYRASGDGGTDGRLPPLRHTFHAIEVDDEALEFRATAGALALTGAEGEPEADIGFVAYALAGADAAARPVTFAVNGGPGAASAYLQLGVLGPWIVEMEGDTISPSMPVELVENPETWLAFTDLVFIDPVGTGFSRLVEPTGSLRDRYLSVRGDIDALASFMTQWLDRNARMGSPKYFVGESYGGFRGPLLAEALQTDHGVGLAGMTLLSPVLDFGWWTQPDYNPLPLVALLPSLAAANMERRGEFDEQALLAVEDYAAKGYVADLLAGIRDDEALARVVQEVARITGLRLAVVRDQDGRIGMSDFIRELARRDGRLASIYDTTITAALPTRRGGRAPDPVLDAMTAPLTSGMLALYRHRLEWSPDRRYQLLNNTVNRAWNWGRGRGQPEAVTALRRVLALDEEHRLLVVHGYTDLVTPYFASALLLRQIRPSGDDSRVLQETYRGGHMFYTRAESRRAFLADARALYRD